MWVNNPVPSAQIIVILLIPILLFYLASLTPKAVAQDTITNVKKFAPSGIDWNTLCTDLSQMKVLLRKCIYDIIEPKMDNLC